MTPEIVSGWVENLLQQCTRWNIVFVQLGDAYPAAREAILPRVDSAVHVSDYLLERETRGSLRLVLDVEELLLPGNWSLGRLRERVVADRDNGARVILLSRKPRIAFPNVPGSSVLRDAKLVPPPSYPVRAGVISGFGAEASSTGTPSEIVLAHALRELGEAACASLDSLVFEDGDDIHQLTTLEDPLQDALLSSGLVVSDDGLLSWALENPPRQIRQALSDVIAGMQNPQSEFTHVAADCWAIERLVKHALRSRAKALWGDKWKCELLDADMRATALSRATKGTYARAEAIDDLRDPLEWLTLAESLLVRASPQVGSLGVPAAMWKKLGTELLPIKDRVERSQLMRKHDQNVAHRWAEILSGRLSTSGSRSPDDVIAIASASATQGEIMRAIRAELSENTRFLGDVEKDVMSLVTATVRFLAHTLDSRSDYTVPFTDRKDAPLERAVQDAFKAYLDMSDLAGRVEVEVSSIAAGRADVVLYLNDGKRYVTEVKRELKKASRGDLDAAYLPQTVAYQAANVPFGQLLVLDLTKRSGPETERLDQSIWVAHKRDAEGAVIASTVVAVVRGNRPSPSERK